MIWLIGVVLIEVGIAGLAIWRDPLEDVRPRRQAGTPQR
jgi:hypothetical protein